MRGVCLTHLELRPLLAHQVACQHILVAGQEGDDPPGHITLLPPAATSWAVLDVLLLLLLHFVSGQSGVLPCVLDRLGSVDMQPYVGFGAGFGLYTGFGRAEQ